APARVNDDVGNTDQFLPSVAVTTDGAVGVMWYDRRDDPLHNGVLEVYGTLSKDGTSFGTARRISTAGWLPLTTPLDIRSNYHGDYNQMSALTDRPGFFINWGDDRSGLDADVYGAVVESAIFTEDLTDLILSPLVTAQTIIAGQGTTVRLKIK